ncbi:unnamed protein product [Rotaria sp. Silwood2]|nr:unnamed protein product [Rotaria sp. Silwood2]CAF3982419.1 unnamed protein product [Rotaria sp. Silwood2]
MTLSKFKFLPVIVLFEIFAYLSPAEILQSFISLNKRFSAIIINEYLWHIHIGGNTISLSMFNHRCQNDNIIGGWSLVSSSLKYHQTILLQRLHLIDIKPYEFDKFLRSSLVKQLHTLLVDVASDSDFNYQDVEGAYLAKVCSQLSTLTICRLPFIFCSHTRNGLSTNSSTPPLMTLPNLSNTTHLRSLTIGMNTSRFLERLLLCVPFIENLSVGVQDPEKSCPISVSGEKLFPHANKLLIIVCERESCLADLSSCRSSMSLLVPWSLLIKISIDNYDTISTAQLASMLQLPYNIQTLEIDDDDGVLPRGLLRNEDNLGTIVNRQIQSLHLFDWSLTMRDVQDYCTLLINQLPNLKDIFFVVYKSFDGWYWERPRSVADQNESSKHIVNLIHLIVNHLKQLVSLRI